MSTATEVRKPEIGKPRVKERAEVRSLQTPVAPLLGALPQLQAERLFTTVLLETSGSEHRRRRLSAVLSFMVQCFVLGILLVIPLIVTDVLPQQQLLTFLIAPPPPPPPPPAASEAAARVVRRVESEMANGHLRMPSKIPKSIQMIREDEAPPELSGGGVPGGVPGGIPGGQVGGVIGGILSSTPTAAVIPKLVAPAPTKRIRVSQGVTEGRIIRRIEPRYPALAIAARVEGQVLLTAIISKNGEIQNLTLISGHPMLVRSAIDAVRQWRYRPFLLNGEPVEVETTITVNFQLSQ